MTEERQPVPEQPAEDLPDVKNDPVDEEAEAPVEETEDASG
ncbi:MAG TPA: hypothetical protein VJP59_00160 [Gemmatimonadota bacterium]|nr:hypothetical protein [Gemmatimonadota bacterium]